MALRPLCLVLFTCSGSWAQTLWVSQPGSVQAIEGGSVTLPCLYSSSREPQLGSYAWVKEVAGARLEVSNETQEFRGRVSWTRDRSFLQERRADVEIRELRPYDSGTYRCLVKIPPLGEGAGNGTWLQVVKPAPPPAPLALGALSSGVGITVGLVGSAAVLILICHKRRQDRREAGPQTGEVPAPAQAQAPAPELNYAEIRVLMGRRPAPVGEHILYTAVGRKGRG